MREIIGGNSYRAALVVDRVLHVPTTVEGDAVMLDLFLKRIQPYIGGSLVYGIDPRAGELRHSRDAGFDVSRLHCMYPQVGSARAFCR